MNKRYSENQIQKYESWCQNRTLAVEANDRNNEVQTENAIWKILKNQVYKEGIEVKTKMEIASSTSKM